MPNASNANSSQEGGFILLLARMLICWIFVHSALGQIVSFAYWTGRVAEKGVPLPAVAITASIVLQLVGGMALLVGAETRLATWALIVFLIPTTPIMHNFWMMQGAARDAQENNFLRNMAILGGLLYVGKFGGGHYSVDSWAEAPRAAPEKLT